MIETAEKLRHWSEGLNGTEQYVDHMGFIISEVRNYNVF